MLFFQIPKRKGIQKLKENNNKLLRMAKYLNGKILCSCMYVQDTNKGGKQGHSHPVDSEY